MRTIHKDAYGFMWFGTSDGLDRFDGIEIRSFSDRFPDQHRRVNCIINDPEQGLWIGTEKGLFFWDMISPAFTRVELPYGPGEVSALISLPGDTMIIAAASYGIYLINKNGIITRELKKWTHEETPIRITGMTLDAEKIVWMSTSRFLISIDSENYHIETYLNDQSTSALNTFSSICRLDKHLVLGTQTRGLFLFDTESKSFSPYINIGSNYILSMQHHNGQLYIGTDGLGMIILDVSTGQTSSITQDLSKPGSINSNAVYSIFIEDNLRYWLGTYSGGVNYRSSIEGYFKLANQDTQIPANSFNNRAILFDSDGNKFIGTDGNGLIVIRPSGSSHLVNSQNNIRLRSNVILSMHLHKDQLLLGTFRGGVSVLDPTLTKVDIFRQEGVMLNGSIYGFSYDAQGNLWIAGLDGLSKINNTRNTFRHFSSQNSALISNLNISLLIDRQDRLWTGTVNDGTVIYEFSNDSIQPLQSDLDLSAFKAVSFLEDQAGNIWIATEGNGLIQVDKDLTKYTRFTSDNGLSSNMVTAVTEAPENIFWISTQKGLSRLDNNTLDFTRYTLSDGLPSLVFNRGAVLNNYAKDGRIWFGSEKGTMYFMPDSLIVKGFPQKVTITDLFVSGQPITPNQQSGTDKPAHLTTSIMLKGWQKSIGFRFVALNYYNPADNEYAYRLIGKQTSWNFTNENFVTFTDLKPGKYTFEICLASGKQSNSENITSVDIVLKPFLYQHPVFIITLMLVVLGIVSLTVWFIRRLKRHVRQLQSRQSEKQGQGRYESSHLSTEKRKEIEEMLVNFIRENKPFLNPNLKMNDLAKMIDCTPHDISQVINQNLNQNFYAFINAYRVEAVKNRMNDPAYAKYTLLAIAQQCGYSSKTSFYRAFKNLTGQSPQEYQAHLKEGHTDQHAGTKTDSQGSPYKVKPKH